MCVNCMTNTAALPETGPLRLTETEAAILAEKTDRFPTREQIKADFLAWNAARPHPWPLCPECDGIMDTRETHPLLPDICGGCSANVIDKLLMKLAFAKGKKARKKALRRIERLARAVA